MCKLIHGVRTASLLCIGTGYVQFRAEFDLVLYVLVLDHSNHDKLEWAKGVAPSSNFSQVL